MEAEESEEFVEKVIAVREDPDKMMKRIRAENKLRAEQKRL